MNYKYKYSKYKTKYLQLVGGHNVLNTDKIKGITMLNLQFADFFKFLDDNEKIKQQMDYHLKLDYEQQTGSSFPTASIIKYWKRDYSEQEHYVVLLYEKKYIGSFRYHKTDFSEMEGIDVPHKIYTFISEVHVIPEYRRMGIMYETFITFMKNNNRYALTVDDHNKKAINMYNKLGFIKYDSGYNFSVFIRNEINDKK